MLIICGSDASISAALRIKEIDAQADVTIVLADAFPNFSICGLPFFISGEVQDWRSTAHRNLAEIEGHGIHVMTDHRAELTSRNVRVVTGQAVRAIVRKDDGLAAETASGAQEPADLVLLATGAKPSTGLARTAGIDPGAGGAIEVDRTMATNVRDIWAAGDCVRTWHRFLQRHVYMPLGTTAHKQGRVPGENMMGRRCEYQGSLGTQVVKVFDTVAAGTGLRDKAAAASGFDPLTVQLTGWDHKVYYPGAKQMHIRVTGDRGTGRLLGTQIVGPRDTEVSKRIDIFATALFHGMSVEGLCDLDLSYTPPLSSPWDPVQMAARQWVTQRHAEKS